MDLPIRLSRDRILLYGAGLFLVGLWQIVSNTLHQGYADWPCFWIGGAIAGTRALLDPKLHTAVQAAHGFKPAIWPYLPAFAWIFVPASHLSLTASYFANAFAMLGLAAAAGAVLAEIFAMPKWFGIVAALAWAPVKIAAFSGQNTPLALLLIAIAMLAAKRAAPVPLGIAVGLLCYKPTIAAPFVILLLARREWRALAAVAVCAPVWYLLSVTASGGDWSWPHHYLQAIAGYYPSDFAGNARNAVSLPGLLARAGLPAPGAASIGIAIFLACLPALTRLSLVDAFAVTSVLAVATSLHAWQYEPVIMLPAILYAMRAGVANAWLVAAAYVIAVISTVNVPGLNWNLLVAVVLGWAALVLAVPRLRRTPLLRKASS